MNKLMVWIAVLLGLGFVALAALYLMVPAGGLPTYIPGYLTGSDHIHTTHALASLVVGLLLWAYAWFASAKKVS